MGSDDTCPSTGLTLGLGSSYGGHDQNHQIKDKEKNALLLMIKYDQICPALSLGSLQSQSHLDTTKHHLPSEDHDNNTTFHVTSNTNTPGSSSNCSEVKEEKVTLEGDDFEVEKSGSYRASDEEEKASPRKKLRLNKEQSVVLEESFKEHSTLNPIQKQALARQLNLRPRQVEVWFQNRRARTKLKQTEMDCEFLKKCRESLTEENTRLHRELQELRGLKMTSPRPTLFMQMPAATLTMCPSCERINSCSSGSDGSAQGPSKPALVNRPTPKICSAISHSSAAC